MFFTTKLAAAVLVIGTITTMLAAFTSHYVLSQLISWTMVCIVALIIAREFKAWFVTLEVQRESGSKIMFLPIMITVIGIIGSENENTSNFISKIIILGLVFITFIVFAWIINRVPMVRDDDPTK